MPNWVNCRVVVRGNKESLDDFMTLSKGKSQSYLENKKVSYDVFGDIMIEACMASYENNNKVQDFSFNALLPVPLESLVMPYDDSNFRRLVESNDRVKEFVEKNNVVCGFVWENTKWGCKWGDCNSQIRYDNEEIEILLDTAWSPPIPFFEEISKKFPNLTFYLYYEEPGMGFEGDAIFSCGSVTIAEREIEHSSYEE